MVTSKHFGRIGNQLFQKAAAIGYGIKHNIAYDLSGNSYRNALPIYENGHAYQELPILKTNAVVLSGYWQSEKYFAHCREAVIKEFGFNWSPNPGWCSIHVRRGDYVNYPDKHPTVTAEYLNTAIRLMISYGVTQFMFFSDDIAWCRSYILTADFPTYITVRYSEYKSPEDDLELMSGCEHNIISNSTFSWWGAWLNQNPNKVVISPHKDNWFGPGNKHLDTSDLIPDSWIQIKY